MAIEYLGLSEVNGPLVVLEGVKNASYEEIVEFTVDGNEKKQGRIVAEYEDKAVIQVFEGTSSMSLTNTHTRLTGHPMEIGLSEEILGRTFDGIGKPIDRMGPIEWSDTPLSSKVRRKNSATSYLTPIAANTIANFSSESPRDACCTICAASWSCGSPFPEKAAASVRESGWSDHRLQRYRYGYSFLGIYG